MDAGWTLVTLQLQDVLFNHQPNRLIHHNNKLLPITHRTKRQLHSGALSVCSVYTEQHIALRTHTHASTHTHTHIWILNKCLTFCLHIHGRWVPHSITVWADFSPEKWSIQIQSHHMLMLPSGGHVEHQVRFRYSMTKEIQNSVCVSYLCMFSYWSLEQIYVFMKNSKQGWLCHSFKLRIRLAIFYIFVTINKSYEKTETYNALVFLLVVFGLPSLCLWLSAPSPFIPSEEILKNRSPTYTWVIK